MNEWNNLEETLNRVLSDPAEMARLNQMAESLFGVPLPNMQSQNAQSQEDTRSPSSPPPPPPPEGGGAGKNGIGALLREASGGGDGKAELVQALSRYLHPDRRKKLEKALRIARTSHIAGAALQGFGGGS